MTAAQTWQDAMVAARIAASGHAALAVRARAGPVRDRLLAHIAALSTGGIVRITADSDPAMLAVGTDLLASIAAGGIIRRPGIAERVGAALLVVAGAERLAPALLVLLADAVDREALPRLVLLDEGIDDERIAPMLDDRIAMRLDLSGLSIRETGASDDDETDRAAGRDASFDDPVPVICGVAASLGIGSLRIPLHALAVARAAAAVCERNELSEADLACAARLVLAPRALMLPEQPETAPPADVNEPSAGEKTAEASAEQERIIDAVRAMLPDGVIDRAAASRGRGAGGSATARRGEGARGRPGRVRPGLPRRGARLDLAATLIAAAPFQRLRGRVAGDAPTIRPSDIRVRHSQPRQRASTIFAVDASGSAALARLAEVKGAVEHLLAQSYVRRDEVALVAFRGDGAETLLPATRSLARARRELAALPGGGGTPLAAGVIAGLEQAVRSRDGGRAPLLLLLTDGGANVARDGSRDRSRARDDAIAAAQLVAAAGVTAMVVDSSPRGDAQVRALAAAMNARYVALPRLDGAALGAIVAGSQAR